MRGAGSGGLFCIRESAGVSGRVDSPIGDAEADLAVRGNVHDAESREDGVGAANIESRISAECSSCGGPEGATTGAPVSGLVVDISWVTEFSATTASGEGVFVGSGWCDA